MKHILASWGYKQEPASKIWLNPDFNGLNYSDGEEIEERLGAIIRNTSDLSSLSDELNKQITDWASLYHLSKSRSNCVRPFESVLHDGVSVLEVGAGCGAITRFLGETRANVIALEGSPRRAGIARLRTRDLPNVEVLSEDFNAFPLSFKFDVITLIGVLEYSALFTESNTPALSMLQRAKDLLKPNGSLILAIENQLGLKYLAGAPEDHVLKRMHGIEGRYKSDQPTTFGYAELMSLLEGAGFKKKCCLAAFPDYKLPEVLLTQRGLESKAFDSAALICPALLNDPQPIRPLSFDLELAAPVFLRNNLMMDLANSFVVVTGELADDCQDRGLLACHYSTRRKQQYCKETRFVDEGGNTLTAEPRLLAGDKGAPGCTNKLIKHLLSEKSEKKDYIQGVKLSASFHAFLRTKEWSAGHLQALLRQYLSVVAQYAEGKGRQIGIESAADTIPGCLVDALPQNIIVTWDGRAHLIDHEWSYHTDITAGFLVYRSMSALSHCTAGNEQLDSDSRMNLESLVQEAFSALGWPLSREDLVHFAHCENLLQHEVNDAGILMFGDLEMSLDRKIVCHPNPWEEPERSKEQIKHLKDEVRNLVHKGVVLQQTVREHAESAQFMRAEMQSRDQTIANAVSAAQRSAYHIADLESRINLLHKAIQAMIASSSWKITEPFRALVEKGRRAATRMLRLPRTLNLIIKGPRKTDFDSEWYSRYYKDIATTDTDPFLHYALHGVFEGRYPSFRKSLNRLGKTRSHQYQNPLISVLVATYKPKRGPFEDMIRSVFSQSYPNLELCIVDDGSASPELSEMLTRLADYEPRVKIKINSVNQGISAASNEALEMAEGKFVAFVDHDDTLEPVALEKCVTALLTSDADAVYTDQATITEDGRSIWTFHKPDWSPEYLRHVMYVGHLLVVKTDIVRRLGGFRGEFDGVQDFELMLRLSEITTKVAHIPEVMYHWKAVEGSIAGCSNAKPGIAAAQLRAVQEFLERNRMPAEALPHQTLVHGCQIKPCLTNHLKISVIIPSKDQPDAIGPCLHSIYSKTAYPNFEVIVVDSGTTDSRALSILRSNPITLIDFDRQFNFSAACNLGASHASGEILVFLNNDTEVVAENWLDHFALLLLEESVGAVGALLSYADGTVQHAGVVLGARQTADHVGRHFPANDNGYVGSLSCPREVSAVTGACLGIRTKTFEEVGGFSELFGTHYQDVDLCLKLQQRSMRCVYAPEIQLLHHESLSRGSDSYDVLDRLLLIDTWREKLAQPDPYYPRWFSLERLDYSTK